MPHTRVEAFWNAQTNKQCYRKKVNGTVELIGRTEFLSLWTQLTNCEFPNQPAATQEART